MKPVKSIELEVTETTSVNISMKTSDGVDVFPPLSPPPLCVKGDIVEVRVTEIKLQSELDVHKLFVRVDKSKANNSRAVTQIIGSMRRPRAQGDENNRREALLWCNSLKSYINRLVKENNSKYVIVLDVGSGDGQSLDYIGPTSPKISRVFIEPDRDRYKRLYKCLRVRRPSARTKHLRSALLQLKSRKTKAVVTNCSLLVLREDHQLIQVLMPKVRAIVCTFSI